MSDDTLASDRMMATTNLPLSSPAQDVPTPTTYGALVSGGTTDTEMEHASGNIVSLTDPVKAGSMGNMTVYQAMADTQFAESLFRNVKVMTVNEFDVVGGQVSIRPWNTWVTDPFVSDKLANFNYIRGGMIISGVLKAPALTCGLAVVTAIPSFESTSPFNFYEEMALVPLHAIIDLSTSSDFELTLPWVCASDWGNLEDNLFMGSWQITVTTLSIIKTAIGGGCASANLTVFARPAPDFQLAGATFQSGRASINRSTPSTRARATRMPATISSRPAASTPNAPAPVTTAITQAQQKVSDATGGLKISGIAKGVAKVADVAAKVPMLSTVASGVSWAANGIASVAEWFGFTRETTVPTPTEALVKTSQNLINADGNDTSRIGAMLSTNGISRNPAFGPGLSGIDEASFAFIFDKYTLIDRMTFVVGNPVSEDYLIPVTPCIGVYKQNGSRYLPTSAGYIGSRFQFWRGDMKYLIYPVVSSVHRGSLQVAWQPVPHEDDINVDITNLSANTILDIAAAQPYVVTVGYNNDNPMCYTDFYTADSEVTVADYDTVNGYLRFRTLIPITGSDCATTVDVLIFAAAGENMQFALPSEDIVVEGEVMNIGEDVGFQPTFQSGVVGAVPQELVEVDLIPSSGSYPMAEIHSGEVIASVRTFLGKPHKMHPPLGYLSVTDELVVEPWFDFTFGYGDYINWFGSMFLGVATSMRYKYIVDTGSVELEGGYSHLNTVPMISHLTLAKGAYPLSEVAPTVTNHSLSSEIMVPYYWREKFVPAYQELTAWSNQRPPNVLQWPRVSEPNEGFTGRVQIYRSAGADLRLNYFRGQCAFVFVEGLAPHTQWTPIDVLVDPDPPALEVRTASLKTRDRPARDDEQSKVAALNRYRARTGRKDYRPITRSKQRIPIADAMALLRREHPVRFPATRSELHKGSG